MMQRKIYVFSVVDLYVSLSVINLQDITNIENYMYIELCADLVTFITSLSIHPSRYISIYKRAL